MNLLLENDEHIKNLIYQYLLIYTVKWYKFYK